jgi:dGTPase
LLNLEELCSEVPLFRDYYLQVQAAHADASVKLKFNEALRHLLGYLASDLISHTGRLVREAGVTTAEDIRRSPTRLAGFSETARAQNSQLKGFLFAHIYQHPQITEDCDRSIRCLEELFHLYVRQPDSMPESYELLAVQGSRHQVVCDYIAGMTDQFLLRQYQEQFGKLPALSAIYAPSPRQQVK